VPKSKSFVSFNQDKNTDSGSADFEQMIDDSVDAIRAVNTLKYVDQRVILAYKAMGYANWEIGEIMKISERTVRRRIKSIKRFVRKFG